MATSAKRAKRGKHPRRWYYRAADNLRSELIWKDLPVGLAAAVVLSLLVTTAPSRLPAVVFFVATMQYALWRFMLYYRDHEGRFREHWLLVQTAVALTLSAIRALSWLASALDGRLGAEPLGGTLQSWYFLPYALAAVLVTLLVSVSIGTLSAVMLAMLCGLVQGDVYVVAFALTGSMAGTYAVRQYRDRAAVLKAGLTIGVINLPAAFSVELLRAGGTPFQGIGSESLAALAGGLLTATLVSVLLPAFEWLFRITTDIRLLELSNLNSPLLRELSVEAPGTYHHSLMVGTLAEAAAEAIGANSLLVRVRAYYHAIGKLLKPEYFVENQSFSASKHTALTPRMSCIVIASHVKEGLDLARRNGIPRKIADMIPQHHGTRVMSYFYQKALDEAQHGDVGIHDSDYRYPGPKPQSREAAVIMMADAVEAASRTLTSPSAAQVQGMIDRLVGEIERDDQLDESNITFSDVRRAKESFLRVLTSVHHRRIDYPGYDFRENSQQGERDSAPGCGAKPAKTV